MSAISTNNPVSTIPGIDLSWAFNSLGLLIGPKLTSKIKLPLSVTIGPIFPSDSLKTAFPPIFFSFDVTVEEAKGKTSTGTGCSVPSFSVSLVSSATTMNCFEAEATIFSLVSAPPMPLMRLSFVSIWSAPSMVKSSWGCSSKVVGGMPLRIAKVKA